MRSKVGQPNREAAFSTIELVVVIFIILTLAAIVLPSAIQTWYDLELRATGSEVSDLMQRARILAAKNNQTYCLGYQVINGVQTAFIDLNCNGTWDAGEPIVELARRISAAAGAPSGGGGTPSAYVMTGDTTSGTPYDNATKMAYNQRGLPCAYAAGPPVTCSTPATSYFVYYFQDNRPSGWCAVSVSKAGRSKAMVWSGTAWQ